VVEPHPPARSFHVRDNGGHVTRLNGQSWRPMMRGGKDTYAKLAYSSLAGFSHSVDGPGLEAAAPDGALVFSEDGRHWRGREDSDDGAIAADGTVTVTWQPWEDVTVVTTLEPALDGWHTRTHVIDTARRLHTGEGGWCVPRDGHEAEVAETRIIVVSQGIRSELSDDAGNRRATLLSPMPGTHLYWPATVLPVLTGVLEPGRHLLRARVFAGTG
jgi:hypothetical protein